MENCHHPFLTKPSQLLLQKPFKSCSIPGPAWLPHSSLCGPPFYYMASPDPANQPAQAVASSSQDRARNPVAPAAIHLGFFVPQPAGRLPSYKPPSSRYHPYRRPEESPPPRYEDCALFVRNLARYASLKADFFLTEYDLRRRVQQPSGGPRTSACKLSMSDPNP
jgi:hypothetical protein